MFKSFVQVKRKKRTFAPLLFGPADLGNIIMFCQVVQVAIEILQTGETNEKLILADNPLFRNISTATCILQALMHV